MVPAYSLIDMASITSANTEEDLRARIETTLRAMGFDRYLLGIEVRRPLMAPMQAVVSGFPVAYQQMYRQREFIMVDTTVSHCQQTTDPLLWTPESFSGKSTEMMEEARSYGISYGISLGIHESRDIKSMISIVRDRPVDMQGKDLQELLAAVKIIATCAHVAQANFVVPAMLAERQARHRLTKRELETLKWAAHGLSSIQIASKLHISKDTADAHIKSILLKLECNNRTQAVGLALVMGLIDSA